MDKNGICVKVFKFGAQQKKNFVNRLINSVTVPNNVWKFMKIMKILAITSHFDRCPCQTNGSILTK